MLKFRTILHPTDFSEAARGAFDLACSLARDHGAELVVLHVQPSEMVTAEAGVVVEVEQPIEPLLEDLRTSHLAPEGVTVLHQVLIGDPAELIIGEAGRQNANLIVMGTHGRTGLGRVLLGSVAEEVSRSAPCPVITLRKPVPNIGEGGATGE